MDLIGYRECGRRLGVSDTAVRKAVEAGRIGIAGRTDSSGRPLVDWDAVKMVWNASGDVRKRSFVGSQGGRGRDKDCPRITIPTSDRMDEVPVLLEHESSSVVLAPETVKNKPEKPKKQKKTAKISNKTQKSEKKQPKFMSGTTKNADFEPTELPRSGGGRYGDARAEREEFEAKLAQLKYETQVGVMVNAEEVKFEMAKLVTAAKTRIMGIPALCKSRYSDLPVPVVSLIERVCHETLEDLANGTSL